MNFLSVSPVQLIDLWDQLSSAKAGENKYAGDVAEVYIHSVMPHSFHLADDPRSARHNESLYIAGSNIHAICRLFEERHKVIVEFDDGGSIDLLLDKADPYRHRVHLRVKAA
jgi:hypothetical protein